MVKIFSAAREYETDIITLFHATGDFRYRYRWMEGVTAIEELHHFLPRVGMKCRCLTDEGEIIVCATGYHYDDDKIQFNETDEKKTTGTLYTLEKNGPRKTKLTLDFYLKANPISKVIFNLTKKARVESKFKKSLQHLDGLVNELKIPSAKLE